MIDTPISSSVGSLPSASTIMETKHMHSMPTNVLGDRSGLAFLLHLAEWVCSGGMFVPVVALRS